VGGGFPVSFCLEGSGPGIHRSTSANLNSLDFYYAQKLGCQAAKSWMGP